MDYDEFLAGKHLTYIQRLLAGKENKKQVWEVFA